MKRFLAFFTVVSASVILAGCLGNNGSSSTPPMTVSVREQDSRVTLTWPMTPGVEYWIFKAAGVGVTPQSCSSMLECSTSVNVVSPAVVFGLNDGTTYSFSINGRVDGGPGGPGTPAVQATPRVAGSIWIVNGPVGTGDLRGVTYGLSSSTAANGNIGYTSVYIAVGVNGAMFNSVDGYTWTALANPLSGTTLNAITYSSAHSMFVTVGANGTILTSPDGHTWTQQTSGTTNELFAISDGNGTLIATGASGTILASNDGVNWISIPSGTTNTLYGVTYGTTIFGGLLYQAVGAGGTILYSADGITWTPTASGTTNTLYSVTAGLNNTTLGNVFVATGAAGTVLYSEDGVNWIAQAPISSTSLNAVAFGRLFTIGDSGGNTYISLDGQTWQKTNQYTTTAIYAIARGGAYTSFGIYDYAAVGARGLSMYAD